MKRNHITAKRIVSVFMALVVPLTPCIPSMDVKAADMGQDSYNGEMNQMTDQQYAEFGLVNHSPEEFDPEVTENPLQDYEPARISELYLGYMNKSSKWKGEFFVMNETSEISESAFNINNMDDHLIGSRFSFKNWYAENKDPIEIQTNNACAIDYDGDGTDEILDVTLYVQKNLSNPNNRSRMDVRLADYDEAKNSWAQTGSTKTYDLADSSTDQTTFVWDIEADQSKGYAAVTAGDFDGDGKEEAAVYVASQIGNDPYIAVLKHNGKEFVEVDKISLSSLNGTDNKFNFKYSKRYMPVVGLSATKISGQDDLVVNVSHPLHSGGEYSKNGQDSVIGIYHYDGNKRINRYSKTLLYNKTRLRFASTVDADVDGNGVEELVIGGYKNTGWNSSNDVGKLDSGKNLIQMLSWNESSGKYEEIWDAPKEVEAHSGLKVDLAMMEPAALTAGTFHMNNGKDQVFLEGIVFQLNGISTGTTQKERFKNASFTKELSINLGGSHSAFISTAYAAKFSSAGGDVEQIVVLSGDHKSTDNDQIYYDIGWVWDSGAKLTSKVTNDNYFNNREEDDDGTFISLCPLDVDKDAVYVEYTGKTYGWSDPVLYSVLQSPPYWSELQYNSETFGTGEVSYEISYGSGGGTEGEWGVGMGAFCDVSATFGAGIFGNGVEGGVGFGLSTMFSYVGSYATEHSTTDTFEITVAPGEDQAIMMAVPMVNYHYNVWMPEFTVTQEYIDNYNEMKKQDTTIESCPYSLGQTVAGHWEDTSVEMTLDPTFSHIPLEEYNELARKYADRGLKEITGEMLAKKTIGDPSTYPHSKEELSAPGNVKDLHLSKYPANIQVGEGVTSISYEMESGTELTNGFQISFEGELYAKAVEKSSFIFENELEAELGYQLALDGGASWVSTNSKGLGFSASFSDLSAGTGDEYRFSAYLAVYKMKDLPMGGGNSGEVYVVGYVVTGVDENSAPPMLPVDFRLYGTTENTAVLKWDESSYRPAKSYEIFVEDNHGMAASVGKTDGTYFVATDLDPATSYRFAVKSYTGPDQTGVASSMSRWLNVTTKGSSDAVPYFTEYPKNVIVTPGDGIQHTLTAAVQKGEGMESASLTYQWQRFSEESLTKDGVWEDIPGATQAGYTLPAVTSGNVSQFDEQTHYRVIARQTKGSNVSSIISKTATMFINQTGGTHQYYNTDLKLGMASQENVYKAENEENTYYIVEKTGNARCTVTLQAENSTQISEGDIYLMYRNGNEERVLASGKVSEEIPVEALPKGDYELFAVYPGGSGGGADDESYYLPSQSDPLMLHVVETYQIHYHLDGGVNDPSNPSVLTNESPATVLSPASKRGYEPDGTWYLDEACEIPLPDNTLDVQTLTGDVELYVKWNPCTYPVSYECNKGVNHSSNPATYTTDDQTVRLWEPSRDGYLFKGWYKDEALTDGPVKNISGSAASPVTLYAKWTPAKKASQTIKNKKAELEKKMGADSVTQKVTGAKTTVTFTSSNPEVATVDSKGTIRFVGVGTAYITSYAAEDDYYQAASDSCMVRVIPKTPGVKKLVSQKKGQIYVKSDKAAAGNTGYQIQYREKGSKKLYKQKVKSSTALDLTIKGLKSGSRIELRLRAYKKVGEETYYGRFTNYKTVAVK